MADLILKPGKARSLQRRHPWIFAGSVDRLEGRARPGDTVLVKDATGQPLARAAWSPASQIRARVWSFDPAVVIDHAWFKRTVAASVARRAGHPHLAGQEGLRLIHGEADGLPGVIADRYGPVVVLQLTSAGADKWREALVAALVQATGCQAVYERSDSEVRKLEGLEQYLKGVGCTNGGIATYMRVLRVAVNMAIKEGLLHRDQYPFETARSRGYSMKRLKSKSNPRSLTELDMDKLKCFPFGDHPHLGESVRLFLFSYYARGMNFADIAQLKRADVYDGRIFYRRRKTNDAFSIPVSDALAELLAAFDGHESPYLFPILSEEHGTERQQWDRIQKCLKRFNLELKEAAEVVGITVPLTSYVARHTFATTLKRKGVDVAVISESMGHESVNTTRAYLKRFGSEVLDAADQLL